MNLALIIVWLALRGLALCVILLALRFTVWVLRKGYERLQYERLMRPKNVYFTI